MCGIPDICELLNHGMILDETWESDERPCTCGGYEDDDDDGVNCSCAKVRHSLYCPEWVDFWEAVEIQHKIDDLQNLVHQTVKKNTINNLKNNCKNTIDYTNSLREKGLKRY